MKVVHSLLIADTQIASTSPDDASARLAPALVSVYTAARALARTNSQCTLMLFGQGSAAVAKAKATSLRAVDAILYKEASHANALLAENIAPLIVEHVMAAKASETPITHIVGPANTFGKNVLPRVAALLDVSMVSDVIEIVDLNRFVRPIYAGNANVTVSSQDPIQVISVRNTAFLSDDAACESEASTVSVTPITAKAAHPRVRFVKCALTPRKHAELTTARIVISGGRGLKSADTFKQLECIADQLGAAVGATRAAVDAGFVPNDYQVGQTGKLVAPALYIAVGLSGAIQHIAGMRESQKVIAINKDPDAPIFEEADYGLLGDLFEILPTLETLLSEKLKS